MADTTNTQTQEQNQGFAGTLRNIQLTDIIQMCCLAGASICVRVRKDQQQGALYVLDGEIVHAECGSVSGVDAFFTILGWQSGQFETLDEPLKTEPTIKEPCQFLLMEAARRADEIANNQAEQSLKPELELSERLRVLIVDDSPIMTKIVASMLRADPGIEVVGTAKNGEEALQKMKELSPDLITMDVNMPVMGGSTALKHIMIESPCPVVIMSNLSPSSYATILSFLNLGAVDFMSKPVKNRNIIQQQRRMVDRVHLAVKANITRFQRLRFVKIDPAEIVQVDEKLTCKKLLIAVSGVGGYLEMVNMAVSLPTSADCCVISLQSIPPQFAPALSEYLNVRSRFDALPFTDNASMCPGRMYVTPNGRSLDIVNRDSGLRIADAATKDNGEQQNIYDPLFMRAAELYGDKTVVMLLSGGEIGSMNGLKRIRSAGGHILSPHPEQAILPATLETIMDEGLISELFDPKDMVNVLQRYFA